MSDAARDPDLVPGLIQAAKSISRLAENDEVFRAGIDAFRAADGDSFQRLLGDLKLPGECEVLCRWIRVKESVVRCIEVCGPPPREPVTIAAIPRLAEAIVKITGDEELIEQLADAVTDRDSAAFHRLTDQ